tara:strand:+ start:617 stop:835 length:219 start_codon:yes stop_codon:yes gene_type:complete
MATVAKCFRHDTKDCAGTNSPLDNTVTDSLAKDVEDYITASGGTMANNTNLNITSWSVGTSVYTLVVIGDNT